MKDCTARGFRALAIALTDEPSTNQPKQSNKQSKKRKSAEIDQPVRYIYYRDESKKQSNNQQTNDQEDDDEIDYARCLYAVNVPLSFDQTMLAEAFSCFGDIESTVILSFNQSLNQFGTSLESDIYTVSEPHVRSARIIYESESSVKNALTSDLSGVVQPYIHQSLDHSTNQSAFGLSALLQTYHNQRPSVPALEASVAAFMAAFDEREASQKAAQGKAVVDEDGFTLVPVKKRRWQRDSERDELTAHLKAKEAKKATVPISFYRFAARDAKKQKLADLREKFEQDKKRIREMNKAETSI